MTTSCASWQGFLPSAHSNGGTRAWIAAGFELESGGEERPFGGRGLRTREEMIAYLEWEEALGEKYATS